MVCKSPLARSAFFWQALIELLIVFAVIRKPVSSEIYKQRLLDMKTVYFKSITSTILFWLEGCVVYCKAPDAKQMSAIMTVYYSLSVPFRKVFICKGQVSNSCNRHCRWQFKMRHFKRQANQSCYYIPFHELPRLSWIFKWG